MQALGDADFEPALTSHNGFLYLSNLCNLCGEQRLFYTFKFIRNATKIPKFYLRSSFETAKAEIGLQEIFLKGH